MSETSTSIDPATEHTFLAKKQPSLLVDVLQSLVIAAFISLVLYLFIATPNQVSGSSMEPNFFNGELLLTNKISQWLGGTKVGHDMGLDYGRGDVIVFQKPGQRDFIKRVIGLPGEKVKVENGKVYINGEALNENYIPAEVRTSGGTFLQSGQEREIPADHYFVMGDNRTNSEDSRYIEIGFVSREWMKGKVILRYWPPQQFGLIQSGQ